MEIDTEFERSVCVCVCLCVMYIWNQLNYVALSCTTSYLMVEEIETYERELYHWPHLLTPHNLMNLSKCPPTKWCPPQKNLSNASYWFNYGIIHFEATALHFQHIYWWKRTRRPGKATSERELAIKEGEQEWQIDRKKAFFCKYLKNEYLMRFVFCSTLFYRIPNHFEANARWICDIV